MSDHIAILGCTRGMGKSLARELAARGKTLTLLGRNKTSLEALRSDLEARYPGSVAHLVECDLAKPKSLSSAVAKLYEADDAPGTVVVTAGQLIDQEILESEPDKSRELATINFTNTIYFCEMVRIELLARGGGTLCVFSSVAGERGRKPVVIYGATKAGLSYYLEALDHRYASQGLAVVTVKPGFIKTEMTAGRDAPPFAGDPDQVAEDVADAIERKTPVLYTPVPWRPIMAVIRALPRSVMRRLNF